MLKWLRSCIGTVISSLQLKHFGKNGNKNVTDDYHVHDIDAVGCLVVVLVVTEGENIESFHSHIIVLPKNVKTVEVMHRTDPSSFLSMIYRFSSQVRVFLD